jgi:hypothetical protein
MSIVITNQESASARTPQESLTHSVPTRINLLPFQRCRLWVPYCSFKKSKSSEAFLQALQVVYNFFKRHRCTLRILRTDQENSLNSAAVEAYLTSMSMISESSAPYRHFQNIVERDMQTLLHAPQWLRSDC